MDYFLHMCAIMPVLFERRSIEDNLKSPNWVKNLQFSKGFSLLSIPDSGGDIK